MTAPPTGTPDAGRPRASRRRDGWRGAVPELAIAAALVLALASGTWAWAGLPGTVVVLVACAVVTLALMRLLPAAQWHRESPGEDWHEASMTSISGFWRRRSMVKDATASMTAFEFELRSTLQHLLAARLSERHGVSLYTDPEAARSVLLAGGRDKNIWYWLDPRRPASQDKGAGIPPRTLAAIIQRLEQL
jgi:hypothetical protein